MHFLRLLRLCFYMLQPITCFFFRFSSFSNQYHKYSNHEVGWGLKGENTRSASGQESRSYADHDDSPLDKSEVCVIHLFLSTNGESP